MSIRPSFNVHCQHCREWAHAFAMICDELDKQKALTEVARGALRDAEGRYSHLVKTMAQPKQEN